MADSYHHRVLLLDIQYRREQREAIVVRSFHGGTGSNGRYRRFRVPTSVAEPREGLLAVTDRENDRCARGGEAIAAQSCIVSVENHGGNIQGGA